MVVSKHFTYFCYPIWPAFHQHQNSYVAYPGILRKNSNHTRVKYQHLLSHPLLRLLLLKSDKTSSPEREFYTTFSTGV